MTEFLIGMGSNIEPKQHLKSAATALSAAFSEAEFSGVYRSAAIGMQDAADFLNACCLLQSDMQQDVLAGWLKQLEDAHGRDRSEGSWKPRTLDLDVLMAGGEVVDDELFRYAHAYVPARELVDLPHVDVDMSGLEQVDLRLA
ncbi:MAG: 2-amino-4-hydroxy-6-hydroxymethyldihydropteridine diphosphokinase [Mariprofundaceae bacterium]|nr:2-amino-4-hydroxy-6-hydroxymethyldihydropteridine diphosphokinase [Mariprofundaceae bacterium]